MILVAILALAIGLVGGIAIGGGFSGEKYDQATVDQLTGEADQAIKELQEAQDQVSELQSQLDNATASNPELESQISDLQAELEATQEALAAALEEAARAQGTTPDPGPTTPSDPPTNAGAVNPDGSFTDGVWLVGTDIQPGVYTSAGPDPDSWLSLCYWARLSGTSGDFEEILDNGIPETSQTVEILPTDVAFESEGCLAWTPAQ